MKKPVIPITSKYFKYVNSVSTDIRKTFAKERERLANKSFLDLILDLESTRSPVEEVDYATILLPQDDVNNC